MVAPSAVYSDMLNAWAHTLTVEGWTDLALIDHAYHLRGVNCSEESGGHVQLGWNCLFDDMPHLCKFDSSAVSKTRRGVFASTP